MATASDIVTRALRSLRVISSGETPTADESADGLTALNDMLAAWALDGIDLGHITLVAADELDVPDMHLQTIRLALAERLAGEYGAELAPADQIALSKGMTALQARYFSVPDLVPQSAVMTPTDTVDDLF